MHPVHAASVFGSAHAGPPPELDPELEPEVDPEELEPELEPDPVPDDDPDDAPELLPELLEVLPLDDPLVPPPSFGPESLFLPASAEPSFVPSK